MDEEMTVTGRRWSDIHPEVVASLQDHRRRIERLEDADEAAKENRMEDFKLVTAKLETVHEKVNGLRNAMWALVATGLGALAILLLTKMADHTLGGR